MQWNQLFVDVSTHLCCFSSSSTAHCSSLDLLSSNSSVTCTEEQHVRTPAAGGGHKNSSTYFLFPLTPPQKQTQQLNINNHWFNTNCCVVNSSTPTSFVFIDACLYFTFLSAFPVVGLITDKQILNKKDPTDQPRPQIIKQIDQHAFRQSCYLDDLFH